MERRRLMRSEYSLSGLAAFVMLASCFTIGFLVLAFRLKTEQVDGAAEYRRQMQAQSFRRVQTVGVRGRILDRRGVVLAGNKPVVNIIINPETFRAKKRGEKTEDKILDALAKAAVVIGRESVVDIDDVRRHLRQALAIPLTVWRDLTEVELARFSENQGELDGFECIVESERSYPYGSLAAHILGRVGRDRQPQNIGESKMNFVSKELCGRDGLELFYDTYLRGMPGEDRLLVDARGFAASRETMVAPRDGFDLKLTLDASLQYAAERALAGCRGAFVAIDPRDGSVRAMVSSPSFDPRECVPVFPKKIYERYKNDPAKPLLNRAVAGLYAPGSTFKPITALAALKNGLNPSKTYECIGYFHNAGMKIRCARTWGHGNVDLASALKDSCNPYFCEIGLNAGTNAINTICRVLGLGKKTRIDFPIEAEGLIPDATVKAKRDPNVRWNSGDVAQTAIGQGLLLVTPLQMSLVAAALGKGRLPRPRINSDVPIMATSLRIPLSHLNEVRKGMRKVVESGTGRRAGENVNAFIIGKTGTAEIGSRDNRRKNTWFIAYAEPNKDSKILEPLAVALVVENGESGGATAAPKVGEILRSYYGEVTK